MGCGMVRKVDELGRVVIPKEMRRVLNIKTGSSLEMFINDENQVVLKKFSEISNMIYFAENIIDTIYEQFDVPCLIADEENVLVVKGTNKKEYLDKKINKNINHKANIPLVLNKDKSIFLDKSFDYNFNYIFSVTSEGYVCGYIVLMSNFELSNEIIDIVLVLARFLSNILKF